MPESKLLAGARTRAGGHPPDCRGGPDAHARLTAALLAALALAGCAANPVTGRTELHLVSEGQEIQLGQQYYSPSRQSQGGDYVTDPRVTEYVRQVGNRLAAVADRQLPYEFVVLNSGELNAWALPGGKIAVNRGLLVELKNEAELAAVLGHEIVHAAARHGAQQMEKGQLLQIGAAVAAIGRGRLRRLGTRAGGRPGRGASARSCCRPSTAATTNSSRTSTACST
ncbi:MAG: M48 family metalloprotease [Comamonadaceae bacterium]|nr:M48 family metalloprotease [Comamonadaceae bacterium]